MGSTAPEGREITEIYNAEATEDCGRPAFLCDLCVLCVHKLRDLCDPCVSIPTPPAEE
jgi:hypothetical protein